MTHRLAMCLVPQLNLVADTIWLGGDESKQALRDKLAGTYVIRKGATPISHAPIGLTFYTAFGLSIFAPETKKRQPNRVAYVETSR